MSLPWDASAGWDLCFFALPYIVLAFAFVAVAVAVAAKSLA
ncbi:hypothetical protein LA76x_2043 [Lysobacter antibioticus]|uniref:Uncharacterized protein n=1 Tax=Lysobacter antibioticus TaxID=84531 RepID=A0A0S2F9H6_LYSAN|nr:hypothetical protein LA76x_2043 [Lysobacter antibioticus]